eukprot:s2376_g1.t1
MSLLLEEAERRFEARLALAQREAEAQLRQIQAKANVAEIELRVQTERALAQARLQVDEAERREQDACAEARAAEARADAARRQAEAERHRAEEMVACERQAKEVALQDMAERMDRLQQDSDRRCRAMQEAVDRAKAEASHAVAECQRLTAGAQDRAERIAKKSQADADDKTHAARAQSAAQTAQAQRLLAQCQAEAQERTEWALARAEAARAPTSREASESHLLKKLTNRISDFESQVASQIQTLTQDVDKKVSFLGSRRPGGEEVPGVESLARDVDAVKYDVGELKDLLNGAKHDTDHVKRIVLACERDMEDFTAAMDAVNVDLDEMRARVDSTHSIITSRQRVEATVTAEISTMRLDMGDMQEALKAHDAWMEDVSQSLQEAHERCQQIGLDINDVNQQMQVKLDAKTDIVSWNDMNDDIDASIRTVRDMASSLRFEVDNRRRRVDEELARLRSEMTSMDERVMAKTGDIQRQADEKHAAVSGRLEEGAQHRRELQATLGRHAETHNLIQGQINGQRDELDTRLGFLESSMKKQGEELQKSAHDRMDGMERHQSTIAKESGKHLNALDLRMAALQGASGESKRDINKIRDEVNSLTVKSAAHDVDIAKNSDDLRKLERQKAEDGQRQKQEFDAIYDELDHFILLTAANCAAFVGAAMTAMRYRARDDGQIGDSASLSVSKNPARLLSKLTFTETDHLKNALDAIKSRRYTRAYTKKPWLDDDGNKVWSNLRVMVAQTVFSQYFETFMGMIIIFNICLIVYEANQDAQCHPEYTDNWSECPFRGEMVPLLGIGNYVLLVLYSIESCARAFAERERFLCNLWNVIDLVTVLLGWMSLLLQNIINPNLLRLSRLVRVLRAARVFISIPEFYLLVSGLYSSFKAILFGSFMLLSTIVVWAIIAVEVLHPLTAKLTFVSEFCQGRECQLRFRSVYSAGLTLFQQVVAGDSWGEISIPLLEEHPETSLVLFPIMVSISLGVMNLILAVIVERATEARENDQDRKLKKKDQERSKNMIEFALLCNDMDADESGSLSLDEMLKGYDNIEAFSKLMQIMDIRREDMETIFHVLDSDLSGEVSYFEFCQHLSGFFERDPTIMQSLIKYSVMELRKVINSDVVEALQRQTDMLHHQTRLLEVIMPSIAKMQNPVPSMPTAPTVPPQPEEPWTLDFWRARHAKTEGNSKGPMEPFGSIQQQLQPLIARAEELVLEALEQRDEKILGLAEAQAPEKLPVKARPKKMERPTSTDSLQKEPRELATLCESFQHRLSEIETLEERKVAEKSFQRLEDDASKLTRGAQERARTSRQHSIVSSGATTFAQHGFDELRQAHLNLVELPQRGSLLSRSGRQEMGQTAAVHCRTDCRAPPRCEAIAQDCIQDLNPSLAEPSPESKLIRAARDGNLEAGGPTTMSMPYQANISIEKKSLDYQLPLWVVPQSLGKCPPTLDRDSGSEHASFWDESDNEAAFEPFLCLPSYMRQALQLPSDEVRPSPNPKVKEPGTSQYRTSTACFPSQGFINTIPSPPGLEKHCPTASAKNCYDFKVIFAGYDQDKHSDFELVPRLIGKRGCNMLPIKRLGADVRVCGRGSGYLEIPAPTGELLERDEALQVAVSCRTKEMKEAAMEEIASLLSSLGYHFKRFCRTLLLCPEVVTQQIKMGADVNSRQPLKLITLDRYHSGQPIRNCGLTVLSLSSRSRIGSFLCKSAAHRTDCARGLSLQEALCGAQPLYVHAQLRMYAAKTGSLKVVTTLINAKARVNDTDERGVSALHFAAASGDFPTFQVLLDHHASPSTTEEGDSVLDYLPQEQCTDRMIVSLHTRRRRADVRSIDYLSWTYPKPMHWPLPVVKLCQVVGVFPGARMNDGTEEELDVDVEMLNWEDCAQNLTLRVEKTWRQLYSQKYRSILDLVGKKADHSVLRLLQISQQHIESQLDRVRHERELLKEVVERRAQQPMPLPMPMKDPNTGITMPQGLPGLPFNPAAAGFAHPMAFPGMVPDAGTAPGAEAPKPPAKRIAESAHADPGSTATDSFRARLHDPAMILFCCQLGDSPKYEAGSIQVDRSSQSPRVDGYWFNAAPETEECISNSPGRLRNADSATETELETFEAQASLPMSPESMADRVQPATRKRVKLTFHRPHGLPHSVYFHSRPLCLRFSEKAPLTVTHVGMDFAEGARVHRGEILTHVNDVQVPASILDAAAAVRAAVSQLPQRERQNAAARAKNVAQGEPRARSSPPWSHGKSAVAQQNLVTKRAGPRITCLEAKMAANFA